MEKEKVRVETRLGGGGKVLQEGKHILKWEIVVEMLWLTPDICETQCEQMDGFVEQAEMKV